MRAGACAVVLTRVAVAGYNATWASDGGSCAAKPGVDPPDPKEIFMLGSEGDASPMHGPNLWPAEGALPADWERSVRDDWATVLAAGRVLAVALAAALGEPEDTFDEAMEQPATVLIMLRRALAAFVHSRLHAHNPPAGAGTIRRGSRGARRPAAARTRTVASSHCLPRKRAARRCRFSAARSTPATWPTRARAASTRARGSTPRRSMATYS